MTACASDAPKVALATKILSRNEGSPPVLCAAGAVQPCAQPDARLCACAPTALRPPSRSGVFLLHTTKDMDVTLAELVTMTKPSAREEQLELPGWAARGGTNPAGATEKSSLLDSSSSLREVRGKRANTSIDPGIDHP